MTDLSKRQRDALQVALKQGSALYTHKAESGTSYRRMCERLAKSGLLEGPFFRITVAGRNAIERKP